MLAVIRDRSDLNGKEKLKTILKKTSGGLSKTIFLHWLLILPIIEQGISDGSIETDYPKQLASVYQKNSEGLKNEPETFLKRFYVSCPRRFTEPLRRVLLFLPSCCRPLAALLQTNWQFISRAVW